jgi:Cu+-exporting ATPase
MSDMPVDELHFTVTGMSCGSCVGRVEKSLLEIPGVVSVEVNLLTKKVFLKYVHGKLKSYQIIKAVESAGPYKAELNKKQNIDQARLERDRELSAEKTKLIISAVLTTPLVIPMVIPMFFENFGKNFEISGWVQFVFAGIVQFWIGARFYEGAYKAIRAKAGNMDVLVALGTSAAFLLSVYFLIFGKSAHEGGHEIHYYFESSAVIITLILLGKYLESKAKFQTVAAIRALQELQPEKANVIINNEVIEIPIEEIALKDIVLIKAGEKIPVDGEVIAGQCDRHMGTQQ